MQKTFTIVYMNIVDALRQIHMCEGICKGDEELCVTTKKGVYRESSWDE